VTVVNWKLHAGLPALNVGHWIQSRVPLAVTLVAWEAYRSVNDGARKPLPAAARSKTHSSGCQRRETLGFAVLPMPW
jgi:hypothetical protein